MTQELDYIDLAILRELQQDGKLTTKELGARVHLSTTPTFERQKRLERAGYIQGYMAILNPEKLDRGFVVFCTVSMSRINHDIAEEFSKAVYNWDEVSECYNVSGKGDYMLKVCVESMQKYQKFVLDKLGLFPYVAHVQSVFVMDTLKQMNGFPI